MRLPTFFFLLLFCSSISAQQKSVNVYAAIDSKALQIPAAETGSTEGISNYIKSNFKSDNDKTRAIFIWLASNIRYDVANMYAVDFYSKKEDRIVTTLKTRKGICQDYAFIFNDICSKLGIKSFVVEGYTKQFGAVDTLSHAWCAALVDGSWFLFDPTWGAGYVNNNKYVKKINNFYYKTTPQELIKSHMPFDYLWQFLNYTVTNQEFYDGKMGNNKLKASFDFIDAISVYEKQNHKEQLKASALRIEKNGMKNSLIFDRLQHLKLEIENDRQNQSVGVFNSAVGDFNDGILDLNDFISYRNKQFIPQKPDAAIQEMIDAAGTKLAIAKTKLDGIEEPDENTLNLLKQLKKSITDASAQITEQQDFLKVYFTKGKSGRKSMFYSKKISWFGLPLN